MVTLGGDLQVQCFGIFNYRSYLKLLISLSSMLKLLSVRLPRMNVFLHVLLCTCSGLVACSVKSSESTFGFVNVFGSFVYTVFMKYTEAFHLSPHELFLFHQITVMDEKWTVFRRYSRFREMHKSLKFKYPEVRQFDPHLQLFTCSP